MRVGLCEICRHVQVVKSARGSIFYLCTLAKVDASFPKYPELPVLACRGYQRKDAAAEIHPGSSNTLSERRSENE
jgi:hypothetical protein